LPVQYIRSASVVSRVIAGETLIIPVRKGVGDLASIYSLNEVATAIWQAIQQPRSKEEVVRAIEREFAGDRQQIERDVDTFLDEMHSAGLICVPGTAA
jgi:Coenzyme PQQ synthesis protein D (PqqD)